MSEAHIGKVVDGRYRLDRLLGEGAEGAVYAATQLSVDRTVALKLLHDANADRFSAEARAIAKLNHTNIITLHDFGYDGALGAHFMVTEFAEGAPLSERMQDVMGTDLTLRIALEIASALHHAHSQGVLHRDLKPENVILTRTDGRVDVAKVLDFGLAHLMDESAPMTTMPVIEPAIPSFDVEEVVRTNEVGRPVPDTDDLEREDGETAEMHPPEPTQVELEPPPSVLSEISDLLAEEVEEVAQTVPMSAMSPQDVGFQAPIDAIDTLDEVEPTHEPADMEGPSDLPTEASESELVEAEVEPHADSDEEAVDSAEKTPAEVSAELDLRRALFENEPSKGKGLSAIVTPTELETSVLPAIDLSSDSAFEEEE